MKKLLDRDLAVCVGGVTVELDRGLTDESDIPVRAGGGEMTIVPGGGPITAIEISGLPVHIV